MRPPTCRLTGSLLGVLLGVPEPALRRLVTAEPVPSSEIWLGVHHENRQIPRVRTVLDLIAEVVRSRSEILNPPD